MPQYEFYDLARRRFGLSDAGSVSLLHDHRNWLFRPVRTTQERDSLLASLSDPEMSARRVVGVLLSAIPFEHVVVDRVSLQSLGLSIDAKLGVLFGVTEIPAEVYTRAAMGIGEVLRKLTEDDDRAWLKHNDDFDAQDKRHMDLLSRLLTNASLPNIPNEWVSSNDSLPRAFAYLEASAVAGVPVLLKPTKRLHFERLDALLAPRLSRALGPGAFTKLQAILEDGVSKPLQGAGDTLLGRSSLPVPALERHLVTIAFDARCSLVDAAIELKQRPNAAAFRRWLWDLQECMASPNPFDPARAARILAEFEKVVRRWGEDLDAKASVNYVRRSVNLKSVPTVGFLFELLGGISFKDPVLNRKRYLTYVAEWFD